MEWATHRRIEVPREWLLRNPTAASSDYLYDLLIEGLEIRTDSHMFDAGCGSGAGSFRIRHLVGGQTTGVSLSARQIEMARARAKALGLGRFCKFDVRSYDSAAKDAYDLVIAVESLIHSDDLQTTLSVLGAALKPEGMLILVEDMLAGPTVEIRRSEWAEVSMEWHVNALPSESDYNDELVDAGLEPVRRVDLTDAVRVAPPWLVVPARFGLGVVAWLAPDEWRNIARFHRCQLLLHRLLSERRMVYMLLAYRKPSTGAYLGG